MKQYKICKHPSGTCEAVKQGWSWPAFLFTSVWALIKKLYAHGLSVFIGMFIIKAVLDAAGGGVGASALFYVISIIISILFGMNGNSWREKNLENRGYRQVNAVSASNPEAAIAQHLNCLNESK